MALQKTCATCKQLKDLSEFKYKMSKAKALSLGYSGKVQVIGESKNCNDCKPKARPKPLSKRSRKELFNMVERGELNEFIYERMIAERLEKARAKMSRAVTERWENADKMRWYPLRDEIQEECRRVKAQKNKAVDLEAQEWAGLYLNVLVQIKARIKMGEMTAEKNPPGSWTYYLKAQDIHKVRDAWNKIPIEVRMRMRLPDILNNAKRRSANADAR